MTMSLEFFGAAGEVTGSCHILRVDDKKILLDCGMIQGSRKNEARNRDAFPFEAKDIDAVILSHAHLDHSGRLPLLCSRGFRGPIHTHFASRDLCSVLLRDSAGIAAHDAKKTNRLRQREGKPPISPLYDDTDARRAVEQMQTVRYHEKTEVLPGIQMTLFDAGHIMGSAIVQLDITDQQGTQKRLVFSGDLGQYDTPVLRDPEVLQRADLVLMESTYGGRKHKDRDDTIEELGDVLRTATQNGGNIIVPAFAIGRSQELLYLLGKYRNAWQTDDFQIFLDSPMAIEATEIYWRYPHLYDDEATKLRRQDDEMPLLPNLHMTRSGAESRVINRLEKGALIIAGSGMCNGGRILHHLKHNLWRENAHVIIAGYQAPGSLGRKLVDGNDTVKIHREKIRVRATVHTIGGLSAHGDEQDLLRWYKGLGNQPPIWLVHGEPHAGAALAKTLKREGGARVHKALPGRVINLTTV
ncbi:MAG: MBL fold metallo-hydrolase RNA specificity domain-containing protein [Woeseiaceae bacterium]